MGIFGIMLGGSITIETYNDWWVWVTIAGIFAVVIYELHVMFGSVICPSLRKRNALTGSTSDSFFR